MRVLATFTGAFALGIFFAQYLLPVEWLLPCGAAAFVLACGRMFLRSRSLGGMSLLVRCRARLVSGAGLHFGGRCFAGIWSGFTGTHWLCRAWSLNFSYSC